MSEHPDNAKKSDKQLITDAENAMLAAIDRHFHNRGAHGAVIDARIPAESTDTDVIVMDALRRAHRIIEQRNKLLHMLKIAEVHIGWGDCTLRNIHEDAQKLIAAIAKAEAIHD